MSDMPDLAVVKAPVLGVTAVEIDGRFSVFNPRTQRVLTLNETASQVWLRCDGGSTIASIIDSLAAAYAQPADIIRDSVLDTVALFEAEGLLESANAGPA